MGRESGSTLKLKLIEKKLQGGKSRLKNKERFPE